MNLLLLQTLAFADIQKSECLGQPADPVGVVYLHGLFPPIGTNAYTALETANRKYLASWAATHHKRVAVPVAPNVSHSSYGTNRNWNGLALENILDLTRKACGTIDTHVITLVGFSNGGYRVKTMASTECTRFSRVLAIGAPGSLKARCPNRVSIDKHVFPPKGIEL